MQRESGYPTQLLPEKFQLIKARVCVINGDRHLSCGKFNCSPQAVSKSNNSHRPSHSLTLTYTKYSTSLPKSTESHRIQKRRKANPPCLASMDPTPGYYNDEIRDHHFDQYAHSSLPFSFWRYPQYWHSACTSARPQASMVKRLSIRPLSVTHYPREEKV